MDLFRFRSVPFMARRNYYYEFKHIVPWSILAGLVEGQFGSIVVARTFQGSEILIAIATATPAAAFLFSLLWGMLCVGRPKVRLLTVLCAGTTLLIGAIAAIPASPAGAVWFVAQMACAQVLLSGVVTVRSAVWKSNYPRSDRGRITARLQAIRFIVSIATLLVAAVLCDRDHSSYRLIFPLSASFGAVGVVMVSRLHIRGERAALRRHHGAAGDDAFDRVGLGEPFSLTVMLSPGRVFAKMIDILKRDRRFARYCAAQAYLGVANLMTIPVVVTVVSRELDVGVAWGFWISIGLIQALPQMLRLASIGRWARLFDRIGVVRFRVFNVSCWTVSLVMGLVATMCTTHPEFLGAWGMFLAVVFFSLRGLVNGLGMGGGSLAWTIGHLHFAHGDEAEMYMGIHVFFTGLRGLFAPALGMLLWMQWGSFVWVVSLALAANSLRMYLSMAREEPVVSVTADA